MRTATVTWDEIAGYQHAVSQGAPILPYIGHDEPSVQFFSHRPGAGNNVTFNLRLPKDPPTRPRQRRQLGIPAAHHVLVRHAAV